MVLKLDDLKPEADNALSLEDFDQSSTGPVGVSISEENAAMLAATDTTMTGMDEENYQDVKQSLLDPSQRERFLLRQVGIRRALFEDSLVSVPNALGDEGIPDAIKTFGLKNLAKPEPTDVLDSSTLDLMAEEALIADADINETDQAAYSRWNFSEKVRETNRIKAETQKLINEISLKDPTNIAEGLVDLGEIMLPFAEWIHADKLLRDATGEYTGGVAPLLGQQKKAFFDLQNSIPMDKMEEYIQSTIDLYEENEDVVFWDGNTLMKLDYLQNALVSNDYGDGWRLLDNITSVLDALGAGSIIRSTAKAGKTSRLQKSIDQFAKDYKAREVDIDRARYARIQATHTKVPATAPSEIVKDVNPELARRAHANAVADESGEAAKALYGTTREEASAKTLLPEPEKAPGEMPNKASMSKGPEIEESLWLKQVRSADGQTYFTPKEKKAARENLIDGITEIEGAKLHKESLVISTNKDETLSITGRFSPTDSGFSSPEKALENIRFAFRNYRFAPEDFGLMARFGDTWKPISMADAKSIKALRKVAEENNLPIPDKIDTVDYAVSLKTNLGLRPEDLTFAEVFTVKRNFLDRFDFGQKGMAAKGVGSLTQHLFDSTSTLAHQFVAPFSIAVDRQQGLKAAYATTFHDFTKQYNKMEKPRRAAMIDYIHEANFKGLKFDVAELHRRGFDDTEIEMLRKWREANDYMWYALNDDFADSLRARGYVVLTKNGEDTKLMATPAPRKEYRNGSTVYDLDSGEVITLKEIDKLEESGAKLYTLTQPVKQGDKYVDTALVKNTPHNGYSRKIYQGERVLSYRDGYYPVMYDAKFFIVKNVKGANGGTIEKVVASARTTEERERALKALREQHPDASFVAREDRRWNDALRGNFEESHWQLATSSGTTAQRVRGERLVDAGVDLHLAGYSNLEDPLQAVASQIQQMTGKVALRPVLEASKSRWVQNYGRRLGLEDKFPTSVAQIKAVEGMTGKEVADARTMFNYIYSMENGYINSIDDTFKAVLHNASNYLGEIGFTKGERFLDSASKIGPSGVGKGVAFKLLLASNPFRQILIQSSQNLQLMAIAPDYAAFGLFSDIKKVDMAAMGLDKSPEALALLKEVEEAGVWTAVDAHAFIREDLLVLAEHSNMQRMGKALNYPLMKLQEAGFDLAERHVILAAYLTFRDKALKAGKDLTRQSVKDEIMGQARLYTYNMNRSGDMPYQQNLLAAPSQFMAVQHKALLQPITNRNLTRKQRGQLAAYTALMFGWDATLFTAIGSAVLGVKDREMTDEERILSDGMLDFTLNAALSTLSGETQQLDFSDMAPGEAYGLMDTLVNLLENGPMDALATSPSGSLLFGANPRITTAFQTFAKMFVPGQNYDDPELKVKYTDVLQASMNMFSGYSNMFKSRYAFESGKKLSSVGNVTDEDVTKVEAVGAALGYRTKTEEGYRQIKELDFDGASFKDSDVRQWYNDLKRILAGRGDRATDFDLQQRIMNEAHEVFKRDKPRAYGIIINQIQKDMKNGDIKMLQYFVRSMGMMTPNEMWNRVNKLPEGDVKKRITEVLKATEEHMYGN